MVKVGRADSLQVSMEGKQVTGSLTLTAGKGTESINRAGKLTWAFLPAPGRAAEASLYLEVVGSIFQTFRSVNLILKLQGHETFLYLIHTMFSLFGEELKLGVTVKIHQKQVSSSSAEIFLNSFSPLNIITELSLKIDSSVWEKRSRSVYKGAGFTLTLRMSHCFGIFNVLLFFVFFNKDTFVSQQPVFHD